MERRRTADRRSLRRVLADIAGDAEKYARELCRNCVRSSRKHPPTPTFYGFTSRGILWREVVESIARRSVLMSLRETRRNRFQACSFIRLRSRLRSAQAMARCPAEAGVAAKEDNHS